MKYFEALKLWNTEHNAGAWCVPRKGTPEYDAVMLILSKHNPPKPAKKEPKAKPAKKEPKAKPAKKEPKAKPAKKEATPEPPKKDVTPEPDNELAAYVAGNTSNPKLLIHSLSVMRKFNTGDVLDMAISRYHSILPKIPALRTFEQRDALIPYLMEFYNKRGLLK